MKSENFKGVLYIHSPNPDDELNIFLSRWSWSDECSFFLDRFHSDNFWRFRTHAAATTVCTTGGVHTLTCRTHIFLLHSALTAYCAHLHACGHTRMAQVSVKRSLHMRLLPSHVSPVFAVPARSLRDHSWLRLHWRSRQHALAKSAGHAQPRTCIAKFCYLAKSDANTGCGPNMFDKHTSVYDDTMLINDLDQNTSDFSKTTNENTSQFGVLTVFESSVSHVSRDAFALQIEIKESMQSGTRC